MIVLISLHVSWKLHIQWTLYIKTVQGEKEKLSEWPDSLYVQVPSLLVSMTHIIQGKQKCGLSIQVVNKAGFVAFSSVILDTEMHCRIMCWFEYRSLLLKFWTVIAHINVVYCLFMYQMKCCLLAKELSLLPSPYIYLCGL